MDRAQTAIDLIANRVSCRNSLGAGQDRNLTVQGSTVTADNNAKLLVDNEILLNSVEI
jgi:hypothetical protein